MKDKNVLRKLKKFHCKNRFLKYHKMLEFHPTQKIII